MLVILGVYHSAVTPLTIDDPVRTFAMLLLGWFTGVAVGLVFLAMKPWAPQFVQILMQTYTRANMVASGKMFVANAMPSSMLVFFDWNPLFHIIDQARGFAFLNYNPHYSSVTYPFFVGLALLMIGMMGEFYTRRRASLSWEAAR
jgi:ABC-type polysaccharide/polyol phosphate export permease